MKQSFLLRAVAFMVALACAIGASAYTFQSGDIYYNVTSSSGKTVEVTYMDDSYYSLHAYEGSITIPSSVYYSGSYYTVTRIGDRAFYNADGLTSLTIPNTVLSIGELAFCWQEDHYCNRLTSITIPNSVKTIANEAFRKCYALQTVVIGDGVTSIGESAFSKCIGLTSVTIGSSVTSIGANAFWGAGYDPDVSSSNPTGLTITSKAVNPPTIQSTTFPSKTYSYATLKVPSGSKTAYQSANYWRNFSYIQEFYTLNQALNVSGGTITFLSEGNYPWITMQGSGRVYAQSGNAGVSSSTSEMTATISIAQTSTLSFDFKAWGEGSSYDVCRFLIDGVEQFKYGARDNDWETYSVDLAAGNHTLTWSYSKDGNVNPTGDYFAVDNVAFTAKPEAYACYTSSNTTLTFYFDTQRSSRSGTTYDLNSGSTYPLWSYDESVVSATKVVFNSSFANARPTTTYGWFYGMSKLEYFTGMEYLNTSEVTNMGNMFNRCSALTSIDVSHFNTANVTNMSSMFADCSGLWSLNLRSFNTANVTNMSGMFSDCSGLQNIELSSFNTANVTDMSNMFAYCSGFDWFKTLDLSSFNTSRVNSMRGMFHSCCNLVTILAGRYWSTESVTDSYNMFYSCISLVGGQGTTYSSLNPKDKTYAHRDGGPSNPGYFTAPTEAYAVYTPSNTTLTFYYDNKLDTRPGTRYYLNEGSNNTDWHNDGTNASVTQVVFDPSFADARPTTTCDWFYEMRKLQSITGMKEYLNTSQVTDMSYMFTYCQALTSLDLINFNTSKVTKMSYMFGICTNLQTIYVGSGWSTDAVTSSYMMFTTCTSLVGGMGTTYNASHLDKAYAHIDGGTSNPGYFTAGNEAYACYTPSNTTLTFYFDTQRSSRPGTTYDLNRGHSDNGWEIDGTNKYVTKVVFNPSFADARPTTTYSWFYNMQNLQTITGMSYLNTSEVTNMAYMFCGCEKMTSLDVSSFNTANVTDMNSMFRDCCVLSSLDVSNFNTANVTNIAYLFAFCEELTSLDLSSFNTSKVTNMSGLFVKCSSLTSLNLSSFNTSKVTNMSELFRGCNGLTSLDVSNFNTSNVTNMSSMFYDCTDLQTVYVGNDWSTAAVTQSTEMFFNCTSLVGGKGTTYHENHVDAAYAHIDGGPSNPGYFTAKQDFQRGDVNGDGNVTISDVTALIDLLLGGGTINNPAADCNGDSNVTISDVTALIDFLLGGTW